MVVFANKCDCVQAVFNKVKLLYQIKQYNFSLRDHMYEVAIKHRMMVDLAPINYLKRKGH